MADEWVERRLGELTENCDGRRVPVREGDRRSGPYPYYGASGIVDYVDGFIFDGEYLLIAEDGENLRTRNTPIAFLGRGKFWVNNHAHIVRGNNGADTRFLMYALSATDISGYLTGSTMPKLTQGNLNRIPLLTPPLREQLAIAQILGTLDDKIGLNRRMNETLEAMARALFKSWFVDFDPVRAKAEGRDTGLPTPVADLFPDSLEDSKIGLIPRRWRLVDLGSCCRRVAMGPFGSDIKTDNFIDTGVPVVRGGNLTDGFIDEGFVFVSDLKADELKNANAFPGDIVITHRGTLGQIGIIPSPSRYPRYVVSQSQMLLSVNPEIATARYVFEYLRSPSGQHALLVNTSQTGVPAIARPTTSLKMMPLLLPPLDVLKAFDRFAASLAERIVLATEQSRTLAAIRDALLPRLISGELRLKNVERYVKGATI
ncbi:MAG TPA: restriction endonuclease subunit S [Terriglobia bacterium]|nr:restriction endonuclease subunit S [Terriglobia bacterium]